GLGRPELLADLAPGDQLVDLAMTEDVLDRHVVFPAKPGDELRQAFLLPRCEVAPIAMADAAYADRLAVHAGDLGRNLVLIPALLHLAVGKGIVPVVDD